MRGGKLTPREAEIIRQPLADQGITEYEIIEETPEGQDLPGCTYDNEIELLSATVVTPTNAYSFWLDWIDESYAFWHWQEVDFDKIRSTSYKDEILVAHQQLRQRGAYYE